MAQHQMAQKDLDKRKAEHEFGRDFERLPEYTADQVSEMVASGRRLLMIHGFVLDVERFVPLHPGGRMVLLNNVGASEKEAIKAFANTHKHSQKARRWMRAMRVGRLKQE